MMILPIVAVTFEIKEIRIPGIINSDYVRAYNKGLEGYGSFTSFPDSLLYALIATVIFFLISWFVPIILKNNSKIDNNE